MSIIEQFKTLRIPDKGKNIFNASTLSNFPFAKIAVNNLGYPVLLIESISDTAFLSLKNIRLKYLELNHNLECKITENENSNYSYFSVITFKSAESVLQNYFLGIAKNLLKELSNKPSQKEVYYTFKGFIEIFRSLSNTPKSTVQGLWSELLLIEISNDKEIFLNYWHSKPEEKFDFNADFEKIEVKSSSSLERIHIFSSEQLNPPEDKKVLIASIFARQSSNGKNIADLLDSIKQSVSNEKLIEKLFSLVSKTLGSSLEQGLVIKFDFELARNSLRFYDCKFISKIEKVYIPSKVTELKYKSDLTNIEYIIPSEIENNGLLFNAI